MTRDERVQKAIERMIRTAPKITEEIGYSRRTCILHTRVATVVLRELGFRARPLACKVVAANAEWVKLMVELGRQPNVDDWRDRDDVWALGIGFGQTPDQPGYDAHLVTVVEERYVLDLTADQMTRPKHGMSYAPSYWPAPEGFLTGVTPAMFFEAGSYAKYQAMPDDRGFLTTSDWIELGRSTGIGSRFNPIPRVREAMAA